MPSGLNSASFRRQAGVAAVYCYSSLSSTNDQAKKLAETDGAPDRSLVITARQTAGRGRGTNRWWSGPGTLTFSVILRGSEKISKSVVNPAQISLVAGLSVVNAIRRIDPDCPVGVKWPNDLYSGRKKVGGILVESVSRKNSLSYFIVGIGLNVNTTFRGAPKFIESNATSLRKLTGKPWTARLVLANSLNSLVEAAGLFFKSGFEFFLDEWRKFDIVPVGSRIAIEENARVVRGHYEGILPTGALCLRDASGRIQKFISGTLIPFPS